VSSTLRPARRDDRCRGDHGPMPSVALQASACGAPAQGVPGANEWSEVRLTPSSHLVSSWTPRSGASADALAVASRRSRRRRRRWWSREHGIWPGSVLPPSASVSRSGEGVLPPEPAPTRAPHPKLRLRARPLGRQPRRSACWERGRQLVATPAAGRRDQAAASMVAPSGARRVDGDIGPAAGALAAFAWPRVLRAAAVWRRVTHPRGFGRGEWQRVRTSPRWPANGLFASAQRSEAAGGSHLWRPEGAVVMERHSAASCAVASPHLGEAQRHPSCLTVATSACVAPFAVQRGGPGQDRRHRAKPPSRRAVASESGKGGSPPEPARRWKPGCDVETRLHRADRPAPN